MATGALTVTAVNGRTATNLTGAAVTATDGDAFVNTGKEYLVLSNPDSPGATVSVAFTIPALLDGQSVSAKTVVIAAATTTIIGPFPTNIYNDTANKVKAVCTGTLTNVTAKVVKFG